MDIKSHRSSQPQRRKSPQPRSKVEDKDKGEPSFICTICWRPQHAVSKPELLGSSARIVCRPCWKEVLNLSICWVCGELIVRGDEVVSLGWCFWHKSCFGCLVCGFKMSVPRSEDDGGKVKREGLGVELEEIPLCRVCTVELSGENEGTVLGRGVDHVSKFDDGLSRERLQKLSELSDEEVETKSKARRLAHGDDMKKYRNGCLGCSSHSSRPSASIGTFHAMIHSAMDTISGDGNADECRPGYKNSGSFSRAFTDEESPDVYVSIFDPVGEPAFKPSKTKPLPRWMHLLPSNVYRDRELKGKEDDGQASLNNIEGNNWSNTIGYSPPGGVPKGDSGSQTLSGSVTPTTIHTQKDLPTPPKDVPNARTHTRTGSKISFKPNPERDPGHHRGDRRSQTAESFYMTPPEYPRPKAPFPPQARASSPQREETYYSTHSLESSSGQDLWELEDSCCGLALTPRVPTPTSEQAPRHPLTPPLSDHYRLLPTESSEFLDRYRPKGAASKHEKYVAKVPEPILSKFKRQREENGNLDPVANEKRFKRHGGRKDNPNLDNEGYGLDPRRKDINQELRNLFREE